MAVENILVNIDPTGEDNSYKLTLIDIRNPKKVTEETIYDSPDQLIKDIKGQERWNTIRGVTSAITSGVSGMFAFYHGNNIALHPETFSSSLPLTIFSGLLAVETALVFKREFINSDKILAIKDKIRTMHYKKVNIEEGFKAPIEVQPQQ